MLHRPGTRAVLAVALVALLHAALYIGYQRADWNDDRVFSDQQEYEVLARSLLTTGTFTNHPGVVPFIPAFERTPGYPAFVAAIYLVAGQSRLAVVVVHAFLFAALCFLVFLIAKRVAGPPLPLVAAAATALYAPFPYWGAFALSEVLTVFVVTSGVYVFLTAVERSSTPRFFADGVLLGYAALVRPAWVLYAPVLALVLWLAGGVPMRPRWRAPLALIAGAALVIVPWVAHVYVTFHRVSMNPVGMWKAVWWGYGQAMWPARVAVKLTQLVDGPLTGEALDAELRSLNVDVDRARKYVEANREIRASWRRFDDVHQMSAARLDVERVYRKHALAAIRADAVQYLTGRALYGSFALWAADIPVRYPRIDALPRIVTRGFYAVQAVLLLLAALGVGRAFRTAALPALLAAVTFVYVEVIHVPLHTDIRYSLPAKPLVVLFACFAVLEVKRWLTAAAPAALPGTTTFQYSEGNHR